MPEPPPRLPPASEVALRSPGAAAGSAVGRAPLTSPARARLLARLRHNPAGLAGCLLLLAILLASALGPALGLRSPTEQAVAANFAPPLVEKAGQVYLLGSDQLGRDILSRILVGGRVSLALGFAAVLLSGVAGVWVGLVAGYYGGWLDMVLMRLGDVQLAFPTILLGICVVAALGPSLVNLLMVMALSGWASQARVVRGEVLSLRTREFVQAARALGARDTRILARHILPNLAGPVMVVATLQLARMILLEAALSFLGLGVQPPTPSWGGMLSEGRAYLNTAYWLTLFPGLAIALTVLAVNLTGDLIHDATRPT